MRPYVGVAARYLAATVAWTLVLTLLVVLHGLIIGDETTGLGVLRTSVLALGALIPFTAFAGGVAVARSEPLDRSGLVQLGAAAALLTVASYGLVAYASPVLRYRLDVAGGGVYASSDALGPVLPSTLRRQIEIVRANPPPTYGFSVEQPLSRPPNFLTYLIHLPIAMAVFAGLNGLLGLLAARAIRRRQAWRGRRLLWSAGLGTGLLMSGAVTVAGTMVRSSVEVSGAVMAWLPMLIPMAIMGWLSLGPARPALVMGEPVAGEAVWR